MKCPICWEENVTIVGNSHYVCLNENCSSDGKKVQFNVIEDDYVRFPHNQIFNGVSNDKFYRKPLLVLNPLDSTL